jgi:hypothetical protein
LHYVGIARLLIRAGKGSQKGDFKSFGSAASLMFLTLHSTPTTNDTETGEFDLTYSLRRIMSACTDFENEETSLQAGGRFLVLRLSTHRSFMLSLREKVSSILGACVSTKTCRGEERPRRVQATCAGLHEHRCALFHRRESGEVRFSSP